MTKSPDNNKKTAFREWFLGKWSQWDTENKQRSNQTQLAAYLGISRSSVAQYVAGNQVPEGENLGEIAARWPDIYDVLGMPAPTLNHRISRVQEMMLEVPEQQRDEILEIVEQYLLQKGFRRTK